MQQKNNPPAAWLNCRRNRYMKTKLITGLKGRVCYERSADAERKNI